MWFPNSTAAANEQKQKQNREKKREKRSSQRCMRESVGESENRSPRETCRLLGAVSGEGWVLLPGPLVVLQGSE